MERVLRNGLHPASTLDFRARLANRCMVLPVYALLRAAILDFKPKLANRCRVLPVYALLRASILDFRARLANQCKYFPVYTLFRASILDFRAKLANRCKFFPVFTLFRASILDFKAKLANRCRGEWFRLQQAWRQRSSASDSNFRCRKEDLFRLLRSLSQRFLISWGEYGNRCKVLPKNVL